MAKAPSTTFSTEAELCDAFIDSVSTSSEWTVYPETGGFDIVLVHTSGFQIAVEAKKQLNAKVLCQILDGPGKRFSKTGPDARAVLVNRASSEMRTLAAHLQITVITVQSKGRKKKFPKNSTVGEAFFMSPALPIAKSSGDKWHIGWSDENYWFPDIPMARLKLPEYVPQVRAGVASPKVLTDWKIKAIKACVWISETGFITRKQLQSLKLNPGFWLDGKVLAKSSVYGQWEPGSFYVADALQRDHPDIFDQVRADFKKWSKVL